MKALLPSCCQISGLELSVCQFVYIHVSHPTNEWHLSENKVRTDNQIGYWMVYSEVVFIMLMPLTIKIT